ncbi:MAG: ATP-binding cassette domain-containing protein [Alphaproteobacteria bacterium]|nr:ATP-binding cassette domain-containing protein [Alphaproteobacteria bacterium]
MPQEKTQVDEKKQEQDSRPATDDAPKLPLWRRLWTRFTQRTEEEKTDQEYEKKLNSMIDENASASFWKRAWLMFRKPSEVQKVGKRSFARDLFSQALRTVSPFAGLSNVALIGTFGLSQGAGATEEFSNNADGASRRSIYIKTRSALADEITQTMPEVEWDMKSSTLENSVETISNRASDFVSARARKYSSLIGVIGSTAALAMLNPALLTLGVPAYLMGRYLSEKRGEIEKVIFPHEREAIYKTFRKSFSASSNVEQHFIQNDKKKQAEELRQANEDLKEITEYRQKRQKPFIWQSVLVTTALTGVALATSWSALPLSALAGLYVATNLFLGSLQSWSMARHTGREALKSMRRNHDMIKHQKEFTLQTGNQKLPEKVDTFEIDCPQYSWRKSNEAELGKRREKPVLDFSQKFYFTPGINVLGGVSGAGKSTLYRLMRHFDDVSRGSISVGTMENGRFVGKKLTDLSIDDACSTTAFSFSDIPYKGDTTAIELIQRANPKLSKKALEEISSSEMFDVPLWADDNHTEPKKFSDLSKGQKARIGTICTLVSPRKILVLDEPTASIDKANIERVLAYINQLGKRKTIIYTSHNPTELLRLDVSNIVYLDQKKDENGNHLPTDVKVYPHPTEEEKRKYVNDGSLHDPQNEEEKITEQQKKEDNEKSAEKFDNLLIAAENAPEPEVKPHVNTDLRDTLRSASAADVMRLHEIAVKGGLSRPKTIIQKMKDVMTSGTIRLMADPKKHKRLYKATGERSRFETMLASATRGIIRRWRGKPDKAKAPIPPTHGGPDR